MQADDFARVRAAHAEALGLDPEARDELLRQRFPGERELQEEVRNLIECYEQAGEFLSTPLVERIVGPAPDVKTVRIGPYELLEELGRGGSAAVYHARRADDLFERRVAIKILNRLSHSKDVFLRFQREIQVLARVEHPYIVRLLDAGTTGEAIAYIVTELIDGQPIDKFALARPLREKLQLFIKICEGVSAAHRNLVVHRDLKPSNILVTTDGTPKVLDFGIAILLDLDSRLTETGLERMTVSYASPEQLRGERPITTVSDVYSLGVLLYELISGATPYEFPKHELSARIQSDDPAPLKNFPRELDAIVRMAMQKETSRRYESVDRLRDDITHFLEGSPVTAHGDSTLYRLEKFARKRWFSIAVTLSVILLLAMFSVVSIRSSREAARQSARVKELISNVLNDVAFDPSRWNRLRTRRVVEESRLRYLDSLSAEYPSDEQIAKQRFDSWRALGILQGLPSDLNLGETAHAGVSLEKAVHIGETILNRTGGDPSARTELALTYLELGSVLLEMNRQDEAQSRFGRAWELGQSAPVTSGMRAGLEALAQQSRILARNGRASEALSMRRQIVERRRELFSKDPGGWRWEFAGALCSYGELLREMGRLEEAEKSYSEALPMIDELVRQGPRALGSLWHLARENEEYAKVLFPLGHKIRAAEHLNRAIALYREIGTQEPDAMSNQRALAVSLTLLGSQFGQREGRTLLEEAFKLSEQAAQRDPGSNRAQTELAAIRAGFAKMAEK